MKSLPWMLVCLLLGVIVWMQCNPHEPSTVYNIKGDTVRIRDTVRDTIPKPVRETLKRTDTVYLPILIDTTTDIQFRYLYRLQARNIRPMITGRQSVGIIPVLILWKYTETIKLLLFHLYRRRNDGDQVYRQGIVIRVVGTQELELVVTYLCGNTGTIFTDRFRYEKFKFHLYNNFLRKKVLKERRIK